jgi:anti-sigma regulatory factor (Ser/Thr protein kinase)
VPTLLRVARPGAPGALPVEGGTASPEHWPLRSYLELAALPTAVPCARLHAKNILHEWRMAPLADTVELLVSEIVTNAVRASAEHSRHRQDPGQAIGVPTVRLWLTSNGHHVLIRVWDPDDQAPAPETAGLAAESGRGLLLVETLSTQWGCFAPHDKDGKIVWAMCVADTQDP